MSLIFSFNAECLAAEQKSYASQINQVLNRLGRLTLKEDKVFYCSAFIISKDLIITAAHCLFNDETGKQYAESKLEFEAGWQGDKAVEYRGIEYILLPSDYSFTSENYIKKIELDVAIIVLEQPIRNANYQQIEFAEFPAKGEKVFVFSYKDRRKRTPSIQTDCTVLEALSKILTLSCQVSPGSSGSPVVIFDGKTPKIVSVISMFGGQNAIDFSFGAPVKSVLLGLMNDLNKSKDKVTN